MRLDERVEPALRVAHAVVEVQVAHEVVHGGRRGGEDPRNTAG